MPNGKRRSSSSSTCSAGMNVDRNDAGDQQLKFVREQGENFIEMDLKLEKMWFFCNIYDCINM